MADPISAIASAAAAYVGEGIGNLLITAGVSTTTAVTVANAAYWATSALVTVGSYAGLAALSAPQLPTATGLTVTTQQTTPPRIRVKNRDRVPGAFMLREAKKNYYAVIAACVGPGLRFDAHWFHDDLVTVDGAGKVIPPGPEPARYKGHGSWILERYGAATETSFNDGVDRNGEAFDDLGAGVWTTDHRGDGQMSVAVICSPVEQADFRKVYPNGIVQWSGLPVLAAYDWRLDSTRNDVNGDPFTGAHRVDDPTTWAESWNPILWLAQDVCGPPERPEFAANFERRIAPQLAAWTQAANDCEDAIALAAGGTEDRYRLAGWHLDSNQPADTRARTLATCDGFTVECGDGSLHVEVGVYREPTFTLPHEHIKSYSWRRGRRGEELVNEFAITWKDPARNWTMVPGAPWRDETEIANRGLKSAPFAAEWSPSHGQTRRLAKAAMRRSLADGRGTIVSDLYGLNLMFAAPAAGTVAVRRRFRVQIRDEIDALADVVVELTGPPRIDLSKLEVQFDVIVADPAMYDWDEATEEGTPPDTGGDSSTAALLTADYLPDLVSQFRFDSLQIGGF